MKAKMLGFLLIILVLSSRWVFSDVDDFANPGASLSLSDVSFVGESDFHYSGHSVSNAGDVNADGYDDILIGGSDWVYGGPIYLISLPSGLIS